MNRKRWGLIGVVILFAAAWFFNRKPPELRAQDGLRLRPIGATGMELVSTIHLYNPNLLSITVNRIHEKFWLGLPNQYLLGELDVEIKQGIPGLKETEFPVSIRFDKEKIKTETTAPDTSIGFHDRLCFGKSVIDRDSIYDLCVCINGEITYDYFISGGILKVRAPNVGGFSH